MKSKQFLLSVLILLACSAGAWAQDEIRLQVRIESQEVVVGAPFEFQIYVEGSDTPTPPDLSPLQDFAVLSQSSGSQNKSSITIINGRTTQNVSRAYVFAYTLSARKTGALTIPSLTVRVDGQDYHTQAVPIKATEPKTSNDFLLRTELGATEAYVGQPLEMVVSLLLGKNFQNAGIDIPIMQDPSFRVAPLSIDPLVTRNTQREQITLNDVDFETVRDQVRIDTKVYTRIRFRMLVTPLREGTLDVPPTSFSCQAIVGYKQGRRGSDPMLDQFMNDPFFRSQLQRMNRLSREPVFDTFIARSDPLQLTAKALPTEGQPASFTGLIGQITVTTTADPVQVKVGDPITLKVMVAGTPDLDGIELPALTTISALARDFRMPRELPIGKQEGYAKVYTQTIRAKHAGVSELPAISLSYFNPKTGAYDVASSAPIPLHVEATQRVTAQDLVGVQTPDAKASITHAEAPGGLAENFTDLAVLHNQRIDLNTWPRTPLWLLALAIPPLLFVVLLGISLIMRRAPDAEAKLLARKAYRHLRQALDRASKQPDAPSQAHAILAALREYLVARTAMHVRTPTAAEAIAALQAADVDISTRKEIGAIFAALEACSYGGGTSTSPATLADRTRHAAHEIERRIEG